MKKILILIFGSLLIGCTPKLVPNASNGGFNIFSSYNEEDTLLLFEEAKCKDFHIKMWDGSSSNAVFYITPANLDIEKLAKYQYEIVIKVSYYVYFTKDYNAPGNIGYAGSPKYDFSILDSSETGLIKTGLTTNKTQTQVTFNFNINAVDLRNNFLRMTFSTSNIQNTIYFESIKLIYRCYKIS